MKIPERACSVCSNVHRQGSLSADCRLIAAVYAEQTACGTWHVGEDLDRGSVRVALGQIADVPERLAHFFHGLHLCQRALKRLGCRVYRVDDSLAGLVRGRTGRFSRASRLLGRVAQLLPLLTDHLERFTMVVAKIPGLLGQTAKAFRLLPRRLVLVHAGLDRVATRCGLHALAFADDTLTFGQLPALFGALAIALGVPSELLGLPSVVLGTRFRFSH